jgi:hypothetical protein
MLNKVVEEYYYNALMIKIEDLLIDEHRKFNDFLETTNTYLLPSGRYFREGKEITKKNNR